jgi:SAM-dependent methyltransferase
MNSYLKLCTEFYDLDKPHPPEDALRFYARLAEQANGPILEPMCGSGRFLVPLLEMGFDVDGVDASPQMLAACRAKCERRGLNPRLEQQFLHELNAPRLYRLLFVPSGSMQLIADLADVRTSLRRVFEVLIPGGRFVFETGQRKSTAAGVSEPWGGRWVQRPADDARIIISWLSRYDASASIAHSIHRYDLIKNGHLLESEFEEFDVRYYDLAEWFELLASAGFEQIRATKCYDGPSPPEPGDEQVVMESVKPV